MERRGGCVVGSGMGKAHDIPSDVAAEGGEVIVTGPDGVAYSMTPPAAEETSDRLMKGAAEAQGQQQIEELRRGKRDR